MKELVSDADLLRGLLGVSVVGLAALIWWLRSPVDPKIGVAAAVLTLAWPLWVLFQVLDAAWDVTTFSGMTVPYVVFILVGVGAGCASRCMARRQRRSVGPGSSTVETADVVRPDI